MWVDANKALNFQVLLKTPLHFPCISDKRPPESQVQCCLVFCLVVLAFLLNEDLMQSLPASPEILALKMKNINSYYNCQLGSQNNSLSFSSENESIFSLLPLL